MLELISWLNVVFLKPVYAPLKRYPICNDYAIMECAVHLFMGPNKKWNAASCIVFAFNVFSYSY